jgi:hypothetical protein
MGPRHFAVSDTSDTGDPRLHSPRPRGLIPHKTGLESKVIHHIVDSDMMSSEPIVTYRDKRKTTPTTTALNQSEKRKLRQQNQRRDGEAHNLL